MWSYCFDVPPLFLGVRCSFFLRSYCKIYLVWHGHHSVVEVDLRWNDRCKFHRDSWRNRWGGYLFFTDRQGLVNLVVESWGTLVTEDDSFKWKTFGEDVKWWCGAPGKFFFIPASVIYFLVGCGFFFLHLAIGMGLSKHVWFFSCYGEVGWAVPFYFTTCLRLFVYELTRSGQYESFILSAHSSSN